MAQFGRVPNLQSDPVPTQLRPDEVIVPDGPAMSADKLNSSLKRHSLSLLLLFALLIRLIGIASHPIWYDEAFSILFSKKGLSAMLYGTLASTAAGTADIHPLGYYTLLWLWQLIFGSSLVAVRVLSILAGLGTVCLSYLLTKELFNDDRLAVLAGGLVALSPFQVHYSQEIRMYSFLAFWLLLATLALVKGSRGKGMRWWIIFAVSSAVAQYTHNLAVFYLIPLALTPLFLRDWRSVRAVIISSLFAALLYLPWLVQVPGQFSKVSTAYWVARPDLSKIFTLLLVYVTDLPLPAGLLFFGLFISLLVFIICLFQTIKRKKENSHASWLMFLAFVPPILLFVFSQWVPVYIERVLLPSGVIFCIWVVWALFATNLPTLIRNGMIAMLVIASAVGIYQHTVFQGFPYAPYRQLDEYLRSEFKPGDVVIHSSKLTVLPALYYDPSLPQTFIADPPGSGEDTLAPATQLVLGLHPYASIDRIDKDTTRIWFIIFDQSIQEYQQAGFSTHHQLAWLTAHYSLLEMHHLGDLRIYLFIKDL